MNFNRFSLSFFLPHVVLSCSVFSLLSLCYVERNRKQSIRCASGDEGVKSSSGGRQVHSCFTAGSYEQEDVTFLRSVCFLSPAEQQHSYSPRKRQQGRKGGDKQFLIFCSCSFNQFSLPSLHPHPFSTHVLPFLLLYFHVFIAPSFIPSPRSRLLIMFTSLCPVSSPSYSCVC